MASCHRCRDRVVGPFSLAIELLAPPGARTPSPPQAAARPTVTTRMPCTRSSSTFAARELHRRGRAVVPRVALAARPASRAFDARQGVLVGVVHARRPPTQQARPARPPAAPRRRRRAALVGSLLALPPPARGHSSRSGPLPVDAARVARRAASTRAARWRRGARLAHASPRAVSSTLGNQRPSSGSRLGRRPGSGAAPRLDADCAHERRPLPDGCGRAS